MALTVVLVALMIVAVLALALLGLVWFVLYRPLARLNGEYRLPGLRQSVEVVRDRFGVPHIYAQDATDLFFAQGFVHAQDRLFQMEYGRRLAQGRLAEVLGAAALEADRWSRVLGFWRSAQRDWEELAEEEQAALQAYAAGINALLERERNRLPAEFTLLGYKPEPWTPLDSLGLLKVMAWGLSQNWEGELLRLELLERLGLERALELEPLYPAESPTIVPGLRPVDRAALVELAGRLRQSYAAVKQWLGNGALGGSNNWVLSPERTASRRPLLANDPHLTVSIPSFWYENHLEAADGSLRVSGASLPGLPGVLIGHNEWVAWGVTAGRADTQDLYVEQRHLQQPTWFRHNGEWEGARVYREEIRVRGRAEPFVEEVVVTRHGPLINALIATADRKGRQDGPKGQPTDRPWSSPTMAALPPLALRWSGHEPGTTMRGLLRLQRAHDWRSFREALSFVAEPSLNCVYADAAGSIGYQYVGRIPRRRTGHGLVPVPGWDERYEWAGWVPYEELPSAFNPPQGYLVSANNKPASDGFPYYLGSDWYPGYRAARIERMLQAKPRFSVPDFQRMQTDVYSIQAERLVPYLIMVDGQTPFERRIVQELETWNLRVDVDSFAAAAYEVARLHLLDLVFGDKLGSLAAGYLGITLSDIFTASPFAGKAGLLLVNLLEEETSWWFHDATTGQPRSREELLSLAIQRTARTLQELIGKEPRQWAWGKVHQISFNHLLGRGWLLRIFFNRGQYPVGGDEHTVWMTAYDLKLPFGLVTTSAAYRVVLDVGDWDRSTAVLSTGQSGQPGSPHYADQIEMWREGQQHPMYWSREAVEAAAVARLWLRSG